jgi:AbrB family looped-hinge helix DNA binding protein
VKIAPVVKFFPGGLNAAQVWFRRSSPSNVKRCLHRPENFLRLVNDMSAVTLSSKCQVVIPREARQQLNLSAGDRLEVFVLDGRIELAAAAQAARISPGD